MRHLSYSTAVRCLTPEDELLLGSEPMQPTPLLLSAEEGGRVSLTLARVVRSKCHPGRPTLVDGGSFATEAR